MRSIAMYIPCLVFAVMLNHVTGATLTAEKFGRDLVEFLDSEFENTGGSPDPRGDGSSDWVYYGKRGIFTDTILNCSHIPFINHLAL